jgi:hypothetical protein
MGGLTGFGQTNPTHRITVNGAIGIQQSGTTRFHINYYNGGLNFSETTVADYRLNIEVGGNVGIGTGDPQDRLHVAGDARIDDTLRVGALEADAIDRHNIVDEVGLASAFSTDPEGIGTTYSSFLSKQITVPTGGYILALGIAQISLDHGVAGMSYGYVGFSDLPDNLNGGTHQGILLGFDVPSGTYSVSVPCRRLISVSSPGTYTYYMLARRYEDNPATMYNRQMDLIFIPTGYGSGSAAGGVELTTSVPGNMDNQAGGTSLTNGSPSALGKIEQLESEIAALRQTIAELAVRVDGGGN